MDTEANLPAEEFSGLTAPVISVTPVLKSFLELSSNFVTYWNCSNDQRVVVTRVTPEPSTFIR